MQPRRRMPRGRLVLFILLAGLLGYGLWWLSHRPSTPVESVPAALSNLDEQPLGEADAPKPVPKKPAERFEFYDILPNQRVLPSRTPDARGTARPQPKATPANSPAPEPAATRWLQVGAFRDSTQAEQRIKQLKLLNIPAQRQSGFDAQGKSLERIVAGPFDSARHLTEARARLASEGLDAIPLSSLGDSQ
ncbi:MAG: SPOR domain-containing protein [Paraperlucidibaca sp.]